MGDYTIYAVFYMVVLVSFLGFIVENVWLSLTKGYVDNRGMNLPFLLGYGLAILLMYSLLGTPKQPACWLGNAVSGKKAYMEYFVCVFLMVSVGEILLGTLVEKVCGFYYWDYSRLPMHVTRYTSVPTSIMFTLIIVFFMGKVFTPLMEKLSHMQSGGFMAFIILFMIVLVVDYLCSFWYMIKHGAICEKYRIRVRSASAV